MPIQQMLLGTGAVATKTYIDDIFSNTLYKSTGSAGTISTGINNATDGGMLWVKSRTDAVNHGIWDTERTNGYYLPVNSDDNGGGITAATGSSPFLRDGGFRWNSDHNWFNKNNSNYAAFNFKKTKGFFTLKEYSGSNSAQTLSHDLGCIPGLIIIKRTDTSGGDWMVYHRTGGATGYLKLNTTTTLATGSGIWNSTSPTSTTFSVEGNNSFVNKSGNTFIAYLFAGGESTAATARSVGFSSSSTYLSIPDSNDFDFGSTFTFEAWVKPEFHGGNLNLIFEHGSFQIAVQDDGRLQFDPNHIHTGGDFYSSTGSVPEGQWTHVAVVGTSGTLKMYINGVNDQSHSRTGVDITGDTGAVTISDSTGYYFKGEISNLRIVKGTAVYTSSFRPPTEPLTNITNTKLLCCNDSSTTGSTVTPGTITANGSPTAETDSPFDDPAGFVFGESGSENAIKTGSYVGNGSSSAPPEIYLGWEPQWVMVKRTDGSGGQDWVMVDTMRGMFMGETNTPHLRANATNQEQDTSYYRIDISSGTGFAPFTTDNGLNGDGDEYIYIALRRPDGYVGKPVELGTDVFAMDGSGAGTPGPSFISNFPVDFGLTKKPAASQNWYTGLRLLGSKYLATNTSGDANTDAEMAWDYNNGFVDGNFFGNSANQGWMWKRHAGFDVVTYSGNGVTGRQIPHSMGVAPEMMWVKRTNANENWYVYHKGHNGGSGPEHWFTSINTTGVEQDHGPAWNDTVPTSTHFTLGADTAVNSGGTTRYIACLFASTDVSKVGYYTGTGSATTITTGFQPRFLLIKNVSSAVGWYLLDTTRGWGSGNDEYLTLNDAVAQDDFDFGAPTSTGFTLASGDSGYNGSNQKYIYYAHA
jgi:hypothetical protein